LRTGGGGNKDARVDPNWDDRKNEDKGYQQVAPFGITPETG